MAVALWCIVITLFLSTSISLADEGGAEEKPKFEGLKYDRTFNDNLTDEYVWSNNDKVHDKYGPEGSSRHVKHIDGEFYD